MAAENPPFTANPSFIQGPFGKKGNFELVVGRARGELVHMWRDNDDAPNYPWKISTTFGSTDHVLGVSLVQSNIGKPGRLDVIATTRGGTLYEYDRTSSDSPDWWGNIIYPKPAPETKFTGVPSLILGSWPWDNELVVPLASGGLVEFYGDNAVRWSPKYFAQHIGVVSGVSLIQSNNGNLEVVAIAGDLLYHIRRDHLIWTAPFGINTPYKPIGNPALIQSTFGKKVNFELVVPVVSGGLAHFTSDNNDGTKEPIWSFVALFAEDKGIFENVSLIQSNFGDGNLEVVAQKDALLYAYVREGGKWLGPTPVVPS